MGGTLTTSTRNQKNLRVRGSTKGWKQGGKVRKKKVVQKKQRGGAGWGRVTKTVRPNRVGPHIGKDMSNDNKRTGKGTRMMTIWRIRNRPSKEKNLGETNFSYPS